ncbi:MAG: DUF222 domain-containing protein [Actinomycetota bacterium]
MRSVLDVEAVRAQTAELLAVCDQLAALQTELTTRLGEWLDTGWWELDGARSAEEWLALFARLDAKDARRAVTRSRLLAELPAFAAALESGSITPSHVDVLAGAVGTKRVEHAQRDETELLAAAEIEPLPSWERTVAGWRQHCDRELGRHDAETLWRERSVHLRPDLFGGWHLTGRLDAEGGAIVSDALAAHRSDPDPAGDEPRSIGQRNADALIALATSDTTAKITVVVDHDLAANAPALSPRADVGGAPVPAVMAERLACGARTTTVTRVGRSILDVTEATPTITVGQRRALLVRDPVCVFPGCNVIADRCDIHHLHHQDDGGEHHLHNLIHLCRHHHRFVHEAGWMTSGTPDTDLRFHPPPDWDHEWLERAGLTPPLE